MTLSDCELENENENENDNCSVRGGVFRRGDFEYNGAGKIIGFPGTSRDGIPISRSTQGNNNSPRITGSSGKKKLRCGNCGCWSHKTVDCSFLMDECQIIQDQQHVAVFDSTKSTKKKVKSKRISSLFSLS